jgi:hypothetical protein
VSLLRLLDIAFHTVGVEMLLSLFSAPSDTSQVGKAPLRFKKQAPHLSQSIFSRSQYEYPCDFQGGHTDRDVCSGIEALNMIPATFEVGPDRHMEVNSDYLQKFVKTSYFYETLACYRY